MGEQPGVRSSLLASRPGLFPGDPGHVHDDLDLPLAPLLYTVSCMHCMTVSLAQGGEGLGAMWGREKARDLLGKAGFEKIQIHQLDHDIQNDYYVIRK